MKRVWIVDAEYYIDLEYDNIELERMFNQYIQFEKDENLLLPQFKLDNPSLAFVGVDNIKSKYVRNKTEKLFDYILRHAQIVVATNKNAVKYATCNTPKKFWSVWREEQIEWQDKLIEQHIAGREPTVQDRGIISLLCPERLLKLTKFFTLYDANIKKISRYQQFFAVEEIIKTINTNDAAGNRQSGVIWHTQGSGKSLTMVNVVFPVPLGA